MRDAACLNLVLAVVLLGDLDRCRRFEIAVEIVEGEDLHFDRRRWNGRRDRDGPGRAAGQRQKRRNGEFAEHQRAGSAGSGCGSA